MSIRFIFNTLLFSLGLSSVQAANILVFGDSLSAAHGMPLAQGWATLLDEQLQPENRITNASISGETTTGGLTRLPATLDEFQPDVVLLALGGNDALLGQPIDNIKSNLSTMLDLITASGARPALAGIAVPPSYGPRYNNLFRSMYRQLATEKSVPYVDLYIEKIATNSELMQSDGIHPNAAAQPQIQQYIYQFLRDNTLIVTDAPPAKNSFQSQQAELIDTPSTQ
ncbi:MAG: arylesterase [Ostreibacterium sp.]